MRTSLKKILLRFHTNDSCSWIRHFGFVRRLVKYHHRMERMWVLQAVEEDDDDLVISSSACCVLWCEKYCCLFAAAEENRQRPSTEFQCICIVDGFHCILSSHTSEVSISNPTFEEDIKNVGIGQPFSLIVPERKETSRKMNLPSSSSIREMSSWTDTDTSKISLSYEDATWYYLQSHLCIWK